MESLARETAIKIQKLENENRDLKEVIEKLRVDMTEAERPMACEFCKFFLQHYVYADGLYTITSYGHCTKGRTKERKPETKACKYFELGKWGSKK